MLVQEQALEAANARVVELEDRLRALEESQGGPPRRSGGFLSGGFAGRRADPDPPPSSVPQVGARATPSPYDRPSAWGPPPPQPGQAPPPAGGGGGFMRSAMATAAGVAGGVLVAESIRNMLGGGHAKAAETGAREDPKQALADQDRKQDLEQDRELEQADDRSRIWRRTGNWNRPTTRITLARTTASIATAISATTVLTCEGVVAGARGSPSRRSVSERTTWADRRHPRAALPRRRHCP